MENVYTDAEIQCINRIIGLLFCTLFILLTGLHHLFPVFIFLFVEQCIVWVWYVYKKDLERDRIDN